MKRIIGYIQYPWAGVPDDEFDFYVEDDATEEEIDEAYNEAVQEVVWNRLSCGWERAEE